MAEMLETLGEIKALPSELHLLCPRQNDDDISPYKEREADKEKCKKKDDDACKRLARIREAKEEARQRREKFLSCMPLLAFNETELVEHQTWIWDRLQHSLESCELCIMEYYKGKSWLWETLREHYDESEVAQFGKLLDDWDIRRILGHLDAAAQVLSELDPSERSPRALDRPILCSFFEALNCEALMKREDTFRQHFDEPFKLIQTHQRLRIAEYVPGLIRFLFDPDPLRSKWAVVAWEKIPEPLTKEDFEQAVKEPLMPVLYQAICQPYQPDVVERLWRGLYLIVQKCNEIIITHNLRALEIDICRLSVDHLEVQGPCLRPLLNTIRILLEKAPKVFWDAMQTIPPQAILERIFHNPQYDKFLLEAPEDEPFDLSASKDLLVFLGPFVSSLLDAHRPQACRYLIYQLLTRLQESEIPHWTKYYCVHAGLSVILLLLRSFTDNASARGSVATVILSETLETVTKQINIIFNPPKFVVQGKPKDLTVFCADVVRNVLAFECQSLKADYEMILENQNMHQNVSTYTPVVWDEVVRNLHEGNVALSRAALIGLYPLPGLEKFPTKGEHNREKTHYNTMYGHITHCFCQILERLADFKPEHLDQLFQDSTTPLAPLSALFSADLNTYQAAVDLVKSVSGQSGRKEAISHMFQAFWASTLYAFSWSYRRIAKMKTFASAPRMVKTGTDIIEVLCDSQTGILRSRKLADDTEIGSLQKLWEYQWVGLTTIFNETEAWHRAGVDRGIMMEFCRDTMQFADLLFDQFPIFVTSIVESKPALSQSAREILLKAPTKTMSGMVKWLRLKDEYLATTLGGLVVKLLRRLGELNVELPVDALNFIRGVALTSEVKTILTQREKAELVRALEAYYGEPFAAAQAAPAIVKKQKAITDFARPVDKSFTPVSKESTEEEFGEDISDELLMQLSSSVELNKARLAALPRKAETRVSIAPKPLVKPSPLGQSVQSFREKREREREEKRKRDKLEADRRKKNLPFLGVAEQTMAQGSGLDSISVSVSEPKPVDSMMVSQTSSESESDEEDQGTLGRKAPMKPDAVREYEESKKLRLQQRMPVKKIKVARSAKDMRARLSPDLTLLHKTMLSWDFFATGDLPPNCGRTDYTLVSNTFADPLEYQRTFEPLLILEAWQGFQSAKEDSTFKPFEIKVANRVSVDNFVEVSTSMSPKEVKDLGLGEADMILLSKGSSPATTVDVPHCLARVSGLIKKKGQMEITYRVNPMNPLINAIAPGASLYGVRISSLTPLEREYGALMALRYYDLSDEIIQAKPSPILNYSAEAVKNILSTYNLNLAQGKAVKSAMDNDAFTLIQGPPGSGKTKTIVALVGALLTPSLSENRIALPRPGDKPARTLAKKLLVCAPSNAAVDELVMRFKEGVKTLQGKAQKISVIRLGRSDAINANVLDVTLDELVNARLSQMGQKNGNERDLQSLYTEHKETSNKFNEARERLDQCRAKGQAVPPELDKEFDLLKRKKAQLSQAIDSSRDKNQAAARNAELTRRKVQQEIIDGAHVICATLSGSGHEMFQSLSIEFETVIIDEAAQSIELSALIPLKYGCSKCILVGDPKQLPPTVLSKEASRFQYEQSLFVRMQANHPQDVHLLDTQYRMHPEISRFPSTAFYDGRLQDGPDMAKLRTRPWHNSALLGPYRFFDVQGMHASAPKGHSLVNIAELKVAMQLYERLITDFAPYDFAGKIGIITPYKGQLKELKQRFSNKYGNAIFTAVEFNTTDAFQGRECEVIIFSCVRASNHGIGFLADIRRMNVGLTRAKSSLWVLGNSQSLVRGEFWRALINDARERGLYTGGDVQMILQTPQRPVALNDIEMIDAPMESIAGLEPPSRPDSSMAGGIASSRAPSTLSSGRVSIGNDPATGSSMDDVPSRSAMLTPVQLPDGIGGGGNGLNEKMACGFCGSLLHMSHNCDNYEAKAVSQGTCYRCHEQGHSKRDCTSARCVECGNFGHVAEVCKATQFLSKAEKDRILREENHFKMLQKHNAERRKERQLGDHDPKVPIIQVVSKPSTPGLNNPRQNRSIQDTGGVGKRKRMDSDTPDTKGHKAAKSGNNGPPPNTSRSQKGKRPDPHSLAPPASDLVIPSKDGPGHRPIDAKTHDKTARPGHNANGTPVARPGAPKRVDRPPIRKKKPVDPFIRPKRR
ncbi:DEAD-box type RNA helicase [Emydomyces testavorans]|uniref:DEAD-box type RNA helicase n=1 Tax=Emydomyces testavorans TaxID=2070801 RepID=A0AAF0DEM5_9EURO|nr:DEAD-box type RNA helicase [Emydomyces testavorans]